MLASPQRADRGPHYSQANARASPRSRLRFAGVYLGARKGPVSALNVRKQTRRANPRLRLRFAGVYLGDTSAFAKRCHKENGSEYMDRILEQSDSRFLISNLLIVELESVLAIKMRTGEINQQSLEIARRRFWLILRGNASLSRRLLGKAISRVPGTTRSTRCGGGPMDTRCVAISHGTRSPAKGAHYCAYRGRSKTLPGRAVGRLFGSESRATRARPGMRTALGSTR
jgi:hypothetical protein